MKPGSALQTTRVKSSLVRGVGYDQATRTMTISLNGRVYGYRANRDTFLEVLNGAAPGSAYNDLVKGHAERVPVERCRKMPQVLPRLGLACMPDGAEPQREAGRVPLEGGDDDPRLAPQTEADLRRPRIATGGRATIPVPPPTV